MSSIYYYTIAGLLHVLVLCRLYTLQLQTHEKKEGNLGRHFRQHFHILKESNIQLFIFFVTDHLKLSTKISIFKQHPSLSNVFLQICENNNKK